MEEARNKTSFLVCLHPLEPYALGDEQIFSYDRKKNTYFIRSREIPEQTTILGMLRYVLLRQSGLLRSDFRYENADAEKRDAQIGTESFSFSADQAQDFGAILRISPVFLIDRAGTYYIRAPFCYRKDEDRDETCQDEEEKAKGRTCIRRMKMETEPVRTSRGNIALPLTCNDKGKQEYNPKLGYASGYMSLAEPDVMYTKLFSSHVMTGNQKGRNKKGDDGFFKREMKMLHEDFRFAFFVEIDTDRAQLPEKTVCYLGQKQSAFAFAAERREDDLGEQLKKAFDGQAEGWYYALSDLVVGADFCPETFAIVQEKQVRNLKTNYRNASPRNRYSRNESQLNLVECGSVFYQKQPKIKESANCAKIGYNYLVPLGGKNE